MDSNPPLVT